MPPAPCQVVSMRTRESAPSGVTVKVVTRLELRSDSVRTRPGSGSATWLRYSRVRPPAVMRKRMTVPAPTPPCSTAKSEKAGGRKRWWCSRKSAMYWYTRSAGAAIVRSAATWSWAMRVTPSGGAAGEKVEDGLGAALGLLAEDDVAALGDDLQLGAGDQLGVALAVLAGDEAVAGAPQDEGRHCDASETGGQLGIVEVGLPGEAGDGGAVLGLSEHAFGRGGRG